MQAILLYQDATTTPSKGMTELPQVRTLQATVRGTGALTATVLFEGSNSQDGPWEPLVTFALSGSALVSESHISDAPWPFVRARNVSAPTGTGAVVNATVGG